MSFLYPRTVSVYRDSEPTNGGLQGYNEPNELNIVTQDLAASIQLKRESGAQPANLPGDVSKRTYWSIFVKAPVGTIINNDIIEDDQGIRYQVTAAYWNSLGYQCLCEIMES